MSIEIKRLITELLKMSAADAPGINFCAAIAELARTGRFEQLRKVLPTVVFEEMQGRYKAAPEAFAAEWQRLAQEMQRGFVIHARQRLTSLTHFQHASEEGETPVWQEVQLALDGQQNDLLRAAFALELLEMVEPTVERATHLRECVVETPSSEEADRYLDEATRCYFYGLYTASAVMCRSVLEEAIKQKLPPQLAKLLKTRYRNTATLGNLLHEVNNNLQMTGFDAEFPRVANMVNDVGRKAVHQGIMNADEARLCLQNARKALELLLKQTTGTSEQ